MSTVTNEIRSSQTMRSPKMRMKADPPAKSPSMSRSNLAGIAFLSFQEFERIKRQSQIQTKKSPPPEKNQSFERHKKLLIDIDKQKKINAGEEKPSDIEMENIQKRNLLLKQARAKLDEELDIVKEMNKIMLYTQVQTVRDRQLEENKKIKENVKENDVKLDMIVELERLKDLQRYEDMETEKKMTQKKGAHVIMEQIKEREKQRMIELEKVEKEKKEMLDHVKQMEEQDKKIYEQEKIRKEKSIKENLEANRQSIELKHKKKRDEKELEIQLLRYQHEKQEQEEKEAKEKKRIKEEKEREVQKLRERQEKAQDRMSDLQSFRAKRSIEDAERQQRNKELKDLEERKKRVDDFVMFNQKQKLDKELVLAEQAKTNQIEFNKIIERQAEALAQEDKKKKDRRKLLTDHNMELRRQIKEKEEAELLVKRELWEEGRKIKQGNIEEASKLENIRKDKIAQLKQMGIQEKYIVDLEKLELLPSNKLMASMSPSKDKKKKGR